MELWQLAGLVEVAEPSEGVEGALVVVGEKELSPGHTAAALRPTPAPGPVKAGRHSASNTNDMRAFGLMFMSALLYSLIPVSLDASVGDTAPLTVGLGVLVGYAFTNELDRRRLVRKITGWSEGSVNATLRSLGQHLRDAAVSSGSAWAALALVAVSALDYVVFASATVFVHAAVAASLFEAWPLLWLLGVALHDTHSHGPRRRHRRRWHTFTLMAAAVPALALVAHVHTDGGSGPSFGSGGPLSGTAGRQPRPPEGALAGVLLAVLAPVVSACGFAALLFADRTLFQPGSASTGSSDLCGRWRSNRGALTDTHLRDLENAMSRSALVASRVVLAAGVLPFAVSETSLASGSFWAYLAAGTAVGALLHGPASIGLFEAHFLTERREIIAMQHFAPLMALAWIAAASGIVIQRVDFLIFGTVVITAINALVSLNPGSPADQHGERTNL